MARYAQRLLRIHPEVAKFRGTTRQSKRMQRQLGNHTNTGAASAEQAKTEGQSRECTTTPVETNNFCEMEE
ncbi:hypothetical protein ANCCAN_10905 [Ancylostoma caninum]|uniref:Uncharacterized protein n=1 Tax=Ancylostoma caninum TaxID=29170 RepID=A0A368GJT4_ANCCA|nr:hypothetical protein ANCCAN_10905 [Ancylostoma caninum]